MLLGEDGDVQLVRSEDGELWVSANSVFAGDLYIDGHVHLTGGNVTSANIEELTFSVNALLGTVNGLQDDLDSVSSSVSDLADVSGDFANAISDLQNSTNLLGDSLAQLSEDFVELVDDVELLTSIADPYGTRVVYESDFENTFSEWTFNGADLQSYTCDGITGVGGNLGSGDSIETYIDLPAHSSLSIQFTFLAIDSWDSETAHASLDGTEFWTEQIAHSNGEENVCGNTGKTWKENIVVVDTITVDHFTQGTTLFFTSTLDSSYV